MSPDVTEADRDGPDGSDDTDDTDDSDDTDDTDDTDVGGETEHEHATLAASPRAIAEAGPAAASQPASQPTSQSTESRPQASSTGSASPAATVAEALARSDLPRMRVFHLFCVGAPLGAIAMTLALGGEPRARALFWGGGLVLSLCSAALAWLVSSPARWRQRPVGALWIGAAISLQTAVPYFGPFSAVVIAPVLGIVFVALGPSRRTARGVLAICAGGHAAWAAPIAAGWIADVGVLSSGSSEPGQLVGAEILILGFFASSYALGRWARHTSAAAVAELQRAMRVIGDQQQALAEVKDEQARQSRRNEGRWTGQRMGAFKLGLVLARGAMGEVYEATGLDGQPAAVKLIAQGAAGSASLVERFHREMSVAARLESPHIVRVLEVSPPDAPVPYLAMERLHGVDLAARLRTEARIPSDEVVAMIDQVARALEVARQAGVVHRDLKPHNLFFHEGATWKVLDFGVAKVLESEEGTLTGEGIVGTPQYMAPEQASGGEVTHLSDVYALGAIAYRCLTGRAPFRGKDLAELVYQVVHAAPVRPGLLGRVPSTVEDVLAVAMAKDPRRRFPSAVAFARSLVAARRGRPVALDPPPNAWS